MLLSSPEVVMRRFSATLFAILAAAPVWGQNPRPTTDSQ